jgi:hypothetical protein
MESPREERRNDIGALWPRFDKFGKEYFTGHIEIDGKKIDIVVFENTFRRKDCHPTMVIRQDRMKEAIKANKQYDWEANR